MAAPIPNIMVVNTFPPPRPSMPLWKTSRPGPSATPQRRETDWGPPPPRPRSKIDATIAIAGMMTMNEAGSAMAKSLPPAPRIIVREGERGREQLSLAKPWRCDRCGATGSGCEADGFAHEEAEHCLTGCNGSLRAVGPPAPMPSNFQAPEMGDGLILPPIPARLISG